MRATSAGSWVAAAGISLSLVCLVFVVTAPSTQALPVAQNVRVSVDPAGGDGDAQSIGNSVSNDGRWVAFWSDASNLVSGDTNGKRDIFVRDLQTNTTSLVSVGVGGAPADDINQYPSISGDGRFVAFQSWADNIVPGDTNGFPDIFVRDLKKETTKLVSIDPPLGQANQQSLGSSISTDGRWIAFSSFASNLATGDSNNAEDVFLADRTTGAITLVSKVSNFSAPGTSNHPDVDADGGVVAFTSTSSRLVSGDANNAADVFTWTKATSAFTLVSTAMGGGSGHGASDDASIDDAGSVVAFDSFADNLVPADGNGMQDVFDRVLTAGTTERDSVTDTGGDGNSVSGGPAISGDGRTVAFWSASMNITPDPFCSEADVFTRDRALSVTQKLSFAQDGGCARFMGIGAASNTVSNQEVSGDGNVVGFSTNADNMVTADGNENGDVFVREPLPFLSVGDVLVPEPHTGKTTATFTLTLSRPSTADATVSYATADGTATAPADYQTTSGTVTIPAGMTSAQVKVTVKGDTIITGDQNFSLNLSSPIGAVLADQQGQAVIRDDYPPSDPWVAVGDVTVWEGGAKTTKATFTVTLSAARPTDTTVFYTTADGTAVAPGDYASKSGSVTIPSGKTSASVTVLVHGDTAVEPDENYTLTLTSVPPGVTIADGNGLGTIRGDD
jgi:hypothetical protein